MAATGELRATGRPAFKPFVRCESMDTMPQAYRNSISSLNKLRDSKLIGRHVGRLSPTHSADAFLEQGSHHHAPTTAGAPRTHELRRRRGRHTDEATDIQTTVRRLYGGRKTPDHELSSIENNKHRLLCGLGEDDIDAVTAAGCDTQDIVAAWGQERRCKSLHLLRNPTSGSYTTTNSPLSNRKRSKTNVSAPNMRSRGLTCSWDPTTCFQKVGSTNSLASSGGMMSTGVTAGCGECSNDSCSYCNATSSTARGGVSTRRSILKGAENVFEAGSCCVSLSSPSTRQVSFSGLHDVHLLAGTTAQRGFRASSDESYGEDTDDDYDELDHLDRLELDEAPLKKRIYDASCGEEGSSDDGESVWRNRFAADEMLSGRSFESSPRDEDGKHCTSRPEYAISEMDDALKFDQVSSCVPGSYKPRTECGRSAFQSRYRSGDSVKRVRDLFRRALWFKSRSWAAKPQAE